MGTRDQTIQAFAERQITDLTRLIANTDPETRQRPCREKLGDGTVAACIQQTADNYQRMAALPTISEQMRQVTLHDIAPNASPAFCEGSGTPRPSTAAITQPPPSTREL